MRFKTSLRNIKTFSKLTASLATLGKIAWVRLDDENVRFTIIPEQGSQVWACISIDSLFYEYSVQSRIENNTINIELPLAPLQTALRSAENATSASLRLTKRDGDAILSLTIFTNTVSAGPTTGFLRNRRDDDPFADDDFHEESLDARSAAERETIVTQEIPIRVLSPEGVEGIHEPKVRDSDVHILLPPLLQLKAISDRFTKLAFATTTNTAAAVNSTANTPKLELSANMHGSLKLSITTDALNIESVWNDLTNPDLEPNQIEGEVDDLPTEKMRAAGPEAWATVRIDGKDWSKVLSVGRLGGKVIACFVDNHALILYVYLANYEDPGAKESVLTLICSLMFGRSGACTISFKMPPKRTIDDVDPADRDAVKRIHLRTFSAGATISEALEAHQTHKDVDSAVGFLKQQHDIRDAARFKEHITVAAAKSLYAAAGLPEPSSDNVAVKLPWNLADDMDLSEDMLEGQKFGLDVEDMVTGGGMDMRGGKLPATPQERLGVMKFFPPSTTALRDVFGRAIIESSMFQTSSDSDKSTARFKAYAILKEAFTQCPDKMMRLRTGIEFVTFFKGNPLNFRQVYHESVDRFGRAHPNFTEAYPATTMNKVIKGITLRLKYPAEDGTTKLRFLNVSACPLWSGKNGLHNRPDKAVRSAKLNTLSPEEIHLGDYYSHAFRSTAPHQFSRFSELPILVRDLIWEFSFEKRIVEIQYDLKFKRIWSPTRLPMTCFVNRESNAVMKRVYERYPFGDATAKKGFWFNFQVDVMLLTFEKTDFGVPGGTIRPLRLHNQLKVAEKFLRSLPPALLPKIRHLGLDLDIWKKLQYDMAMLQRRRHKVYGRERFILPMLTGLESLHIIENDNLGCWRMNRKMIQPVAHETMWSFVCSCENLGLDGDSIRSGIGELLTERSEQSDDALPRWWNGSAGVTCMKRMMWLGNGLIGKPSGVMSVRALS